MRSHRMMDVFSFFNKWPFVSPIEGSRSSSMRVLSVLQATWEHPSTETLPLRFIFSPQFFVIFYLNEYDCAY